MGSVGGILHRPIKSKNKNIRPTMTKKYSYKVFTNAINKINQDVDIPSSLILVAYSGREL